MNHSAENRGTISRRGNRMRVENALVEEVSLNRLGTGSIRISYSVRRPNDLLIVESLRLNIGRSTTVRNSAGRSMRATELCAGMWIDAVFTPIVAVNNSPRSNALMIMIRR